MDNFKDLKDKFSDDTEFQKIHKNYIKLNSQQQKENTDDVLNVIQFIFDKMKDNPNNYLNMERIVYAGSYFKGTKIGEPDEYDFDFVMKLPFDDFTVSDIDANGCLKIKINDNSSKGYKLKEIIDDGYIKEKKFRDYIQKIFCESVSSGNENFVITAKGKRYNVQLKNVFTAFTMVIMTPKNVKIYVDFVPALGINKKLSINSSLTINKEQWLMVAKPSGDDKSGTWKAQLIEQEKVLLKEGGELKPIIRMLKKLRDTQEMTKIKSYFIEILILNELKNNDKISEIMELSKTAIFVYMLRKLFSCIKEKNLPDYWTAKKNLFEEIDNKSLDDYEAKLSKIVNVINSCKNPENILGKYILNEQERKELE